MAVLNRRRTPGLTRSALASSLLLLAGTTASCGFDYATDRVYTPADGVNNRDGEVDVLNAVIVWDGEGKGRFLASLVNNSLEGPDRLTSVGGEVEAKRVPTADIPAGGLLNLASTPTPIAVVGAVIEEGENGGEDTRFEFDEGDMVEVTLSFEVAEPATLVVPVVAARDQYAEFGTPAEEPSEPVEDEGH